MAPGEERWDVFLAHAGPDTARAQALYDALATLDLKVCFDAEVLQPGDDWHTLLPDYVRRSDIVVVLVSAHTADAHYEGEEIVIAIEQARQTDARVVPIHLAPDLTAPYGTTRLHRIDWHDEADIDAVVTEIRRVIPRAARGEASGASIFCHRIPVPPRHFTGRSDLLGRLGARLGDGRTTSLTQTVQGKGGVGKTTVAAALCEAQREHHDIVWWVRAEDQGTLVADLAELAAEVGVTTGQGGDADAQAVVRWLETADARWLVVYDNVLDRDAVQPWLPKRGSGAAIVTSRYRHMHDLGSVEVVDILPDPVAEAFLRERVATRNPAAQEEDLVAVLARVQGLPLALEQAAAWVERKPNRRFAGWVALYDGAAESAFAQALADYEHTAFSAWQVSIEAATDEARLAGRLLGALGHLAPESIAIPWLRAVAEDPYLAATSGDVDAAIDALDAYDLVTINSDDTLDIHRVIHDTARRTAPTDAGPFAVRAITAQDPGGHADGDWPLLSTLAPHARQAAEVLTQGALVDEPALVFLLSRIAVIALSVGQLGVGAEAATTAVEAARRAVPDTAASLIADDALARTYRSRGDLARAIPLLETILADSERILDPDHPDILASRNNLANAYRVAGDVARATTLYEQTLAGCERILGPDHPDTLTSRNNLANAYQAAGNLTRATTLHEQTLTDRQRILGPDHPDTLTSRNNLANAYRGVGDVSRATTLYEQTLTDRERILGPDHPDTLASRNNLANAYQDAGDVTRATTLHEQSFDKYLHVLGPDHPDTLTSQGNLASAYQDAGDLTRATTLYEQSLEKHVHVLGPDHPDTLTSRNNLAVALCYARDFDRAIPILEQVVTQRTRVLGPDHPHTVSSMRSLEAARRESGRD